MTSPAPDPVPTTHIWRVGDARLTAYPRADGWTVRVERRDWGDAALVVDDRFRTEDEALAWCRRLADALRRDDEPDSDEFTIRGR